MLVHLCLRMVTTIGGNSSDNRACFRETSRGKFPKLKQRLSRGRKAYIAAGAEFTLCVYMFVCVSRLLAVACWLLPLCSVYSRDDTDLTSFTQYRAVSSRDDGGGLQRVYSRIGSLCRVGRPHRPCVWTGQTDKLYHFLLRSGLRAGRRNSFRVIGTVHVGVGRDMVKVRANQRHVADLRLILNANRISVPVSETRRYGRARLHIGATHARQARFRS